MKKENFTYSFKSSKSPEDVTNLLLQIDSWWFGLFDEKILGKSGNINDEFTFSAGEGAHFTKQKLSALIPGKTIEWTVTDSKLTFVKEQNEWTGTKLIFELSKENNKTIVKFTHDGLVPQFECYENCSTAWTKYLDNLKNKLQ